MIDRLNLRKYEHIVLIGILLVIFFLITGFVYKEKATVVSGITKQYEQTINKEIGIQTIIEPDPTMAKGEQKIVQEGHAGQVSIKERVYLQGDKIIRTKELSSKVIKDMVPKIIKEGTREKIVQTSRGNVRYSKVLKMNATAYTASDGNGDGVTASGIPATRGIVAVDPEIIPLGTRLYIPGYGEALAADTGGAIQGNRIDLVVDSYGEAMNFGRQDIDVYILQQ